VLVAAAAVLVLALACDNAALAAALAAAPGGARLGWSYGLGALALAGAGLGLGRWTRLGAGDWTPLLGVVVVFAIWMDTMRTWSRGLPRTLPPTGVPGRWWQGAAAAAGASLDELGVGFALGGLGVGSPRAWLLVCAVETALAWAVGVRLARDEGGSRRCLLLGGLALFAGYSLALLGSAALAAPGAS
jgi:hypothetical protein